MCVFCEIIKGNIPSNKLYEDDKVLAFADINPQAPVHVLIVPKIHVEDILAITEKDSAYMEAVFTAIRKVAGELGITAENGMRIINNCGVNAGQTVKHIHFHLLAGSNMGEKLI